MKSSRVETGANRLHSMAKPQIATRGPLIPPLPFFVGAKRSAGIPAPLRAAARRLPLDDVAGRRRHGAGCLAAAGGDLRQLLEEVVDPGEALARLVPAADEDEPLVRPQLRRPHLLLDE